MRLNAKLLPLSIFFLITFSIFTSLAQAEDLNNVTSPPTSPLKAAQNAQLKKLEVALFNLDKKITELDYRFKNETRIADLERQLNDFKHLASTKQNDNLHKDESESLFTSNSTLLNICVAITALFITALTFLFGYLALLGIRSIKELESNVTKAVTDTVSKTVTTNVNNNVNSRVLKRINAIITNEVSDIRDKINSSVSELQSEIDKLKLQKNIASANTQPDQADDPTPDDPTPDDPTPDDPTPDEPTPNEPNNPANVQPNTDQLTQKQPAAEDTQTATPKTLFDEPNE